jgi:hypothetical protein
MVEPVHIEQDAAVAQMVSRPTVPARPDPHPMTVGLRITDRGHHIVRIGGLHDHVRVPVWDALVPHGRAAGCLVPVIIPKETPAGR